ncbi:right-handed parallel beta-helix repeat-containing protein [Sphingomonas sp. BK580]|uniref:right-handed parallel beta-helix repeat-containing protein n=1 Tax=Sphingomonas sp. BK580 TaxID=2586972 RepID=UPI00160BC77A|nr:right-handed parallel beta-helix repeat-containing protein [Sphingomonas sp. BK580]MBB3693786.1 hypothetical protein [Sphingomonas sp. BK580]
MTLRDFGADPSGLTSSVAALQAALAAGKRVVGTRGDVYFLDASVTVQSGSQLVGNGATIRLGRGVVGLRLSGDDCVISGWTIDGGGGLYAVLNTGARNAFLDNLCVGNVGHFLLAVGSDTVLIYGNFVDGLTADTEITTAFVAERCRDVTIRDNRFRQIPVGWSIQIRDGTNNFSVARNQFIQTQWAHSIISEQDQRVFHFTLPTRCHLKKIQLNGLPASTGYLLAQKEDGTYQVSFAFGRKRGDNVRLVGYRGAENIQINTGSHHGLIADNAIDGTGDSGIVCFGSHLNVVRNDIRNCGYAGIAIYGDQDHILIADNRIADCAQMDDGLSSPDEPKLASVFAGAILASGQDATIRGNVIDNDAGTMRYGVRINKATMALLTDGRATIRITGNTFNGEYADGRVFAPNETSGARINSITVDGALVTYPGGLDIERRWLTTPTGDAHLAISIFGRRGAISDATVRLDSPASIKTIAGEHVDIDLIDAHVFRDCNVEITFWAKAESGSSYLSAFTELEGLLFPLTAEILDPTWKQYWIRFPLTRKLADRILIRLGGTSGSANIQHLSITGRRL